VTAGRLSNTTRAEASGPPLSHWGTEVEATVVGGHPCLTYRHRRRSAGQLLLDGQRFAGRDYLVHGRRRITFSHHEQGVRAVARRLQALGVGRGDRVMLLGANGPEWVVTFWATLTVGAVVVPGNSWWSEPECHHAVQTVEPVLAVADGRRRPLLPSGTPAISCDDLRPLVDQPGTGKLTHTAVDEDDPAVILFTSGTTGRPKGATLSHRAVIASQQNMLGLGGRFPPDIPLDAPSAVTLLTVPLFHLAGVQTLIITLLTGGRLVFLDGRFDPGEVLRLIEQEGVTRWGCVPTMMTRVLDHPDLSCRRTGTLRTITMGGAPVPPELVARTRSAFPAARRGVGTTYGLSEAGGALTAGTGDAFADRPHSVGRALPVVELRIHSPGPDGAGEILARAPHVMSGYWGQPDDPVLDPDGWLHTGDIGRIDPDGYLYVLDRCKDVVIRGGENVTGPHIEDQLLTHPDVSEAAVFGLPHPDLGEEVAAVVVPRAGSLLTAEALRAYAAARLANFEVPTRWWIRTEPLPVNAVGKVLKRELRAEWPAAPQPPKNVPSIRGVQ
jgi:long-chain acyl-CoA synthetase